MDDFLAELRHDFQRHKAMAERGMAQLDAQDFFPRPGEQVNPVALIVKPLAGNMASRWTDFLTTDGEKPTRDRDGEFEKPPKNRAEILDLWDAGWKCVFTALQS